MKNFILSLSILACLLVGHFSANSQCTVSTIDLTLTCFTPSVTLLTTTNVQNPAFAWSGPGGFSSMTQNPEVTEPGLYTVTVTDPSDGCTATATAVVTQDIVTPSISVNSPIVLTCFAPTAVLTASSGTSGVTFSWVGPNGFNSVLPSPTVILPGVYVLTVTGQNGCTATATVDVVQDVAVPVAVANAIGAFGCNGGGQLAISGAGSSTGPDIAYFWMGPFIVGNANQITATVIAPGTYCLTVTDSGNGCTASACTVVQQGASPIVTVSTDVPFNCDNPQPVTIQAWSNPQNVTWAWGTSDGNIVSGADTDAPLVDAPGIYSVTVTNPLNGCTNVSWGEVGKVSIQIAPTLIDCDGEANFTANISGGTAPYTIFLTINGVPETPFVLPNNPYTFSIKPIGQSLISLSVTDANGCSASIPNITLAAPTPLTVDTVIVGGNSCAFATLLVEVSGGTPPYLYQWSPFGGGGPFLTVQQGGNYTVTVTDANGCSVEYTVLADISNGDCGTIRGNIYMDENRDCDTAGDPALANWLVIATGQGETFYATTQADGSYWMRVLPGDYQVSAWLPNPLWSLCQPSYPASVQTSGDTATVNIPVKPDSLCPAMTVDVTIGLLRRCFSGNTIYVQYCNEGTAPAEDAYVDLEIDPFLEVEGASQPYTDLGNNVLRFQVGDVAVNHCGQFWLWAKVSCTAVLGQSHCVTAHVHPDTLCIGQNPLWSGAHVELGAACTGDSLRFSIRNTGSSDMNSALEYVVIEDGVMFRSGAQPGLPEDGEMHVAVPADGSTWRLEVGQEVFHPGQSMPALTVEGCTTNGSFTTGFVGQFPPDDADAWVDIECRPNQGSYDPNDKQGFPVGYGPAHYVLPGTDIEYLIRFQNTGTDTAFNIVIRDTLSAWLDPASVQPGAASHEYEFEVKGRGILVFTFPNIMLPDSNVNLSGSNGFVKFRVAQQPGTPLETDIFNRAAIYFDFNEPIITNTTQHRVGENFILKSWQPARPGFGLKISPNPLARDASVELTGLPAGQTVQVKIFDLAGQLLRQETATAPRFQLRRGDLPAGMFLLKIEAENGLFGQGKVLALD